MSLQQLENTYITKDISAFRKTLDKLGPKILTYDWKTPEGVAGFNKGTALTTAVIDAAISGDHRFLEALLHAGANPNFFSPRLGANAIGALFHPSIQKSIADHLKRDLALTRSLEGVLALLIDFGARFENFAIIFPQSIPGKAIMRVLRERLEMQRSLSKLAKADFTLLKDLLCEDIQGSNRLGELKTMAKSLGITNWHRKNKAELCALISDNMARRVSKQQLELEETIKRLEKRDMKLLRDLLCEQVSTDIDTQNSLRDLRALARVLGIGGVAQMNGKDLCQQISTALLVEKASKDEL